MKIVSVEVVCTTTAFNPPFPPVSTRRHSWFCVSLPFYDEAPSPSLSISHSPSLPTFADTFRGKRVHCHPLICFFSFTLQMRTASRPVLYTHTHTHTPANPALYGVGKPPFKPLKGVNTIHLTPRSPSLFFVFCSLIKPACSSWA